MVYAVTVIVCLQAHAACVVVTGACLSACQGLLGDSGTPTHHRHDAAQRCFGSTPRVHAYDLHMFALARPMQANSRPACAYLIAVSHTRTRKAATAATCYLAPATPPPAVRAIVAAWRL